MPVTFGYGQHQAKTGEDDKEIDGVMAILENMKNLLREPLEGVLAEIDFEIGVVENDPYGGDRAQPVRIGQMLRFAL